MGRGSLGLVLGTEQPLPGSSGSPLGTQLFLSIAQLVMLLQGL